VSVETRLVPDADPLQQAADVAAALAGVQKNAASWGGDASKLVLMGHSAGAHLVALVSADPSIANSAGAKPWLATIALDSAAYNVAAIMKARHAKFYDTAFGADPAFWAKASPTMQMAKAPSKSSAGHMLLVCSSLRSNSCPQAEAFASKAEGRAKVLPVALRHVPINATLGADNDYTRQVDAFLATVGLN
jgi:acetyl esterase/lipase